MAPDRKGTALVLLLAISSAVLYACLLPLWEGFDEAFHYGYIQSLSMEGRIPVLGRTFISEEIERSFGMTPMSHIASGRIPQAITFDRWFALPESERLEHRRQLAGLRGELHDPASRPNYEAHQPPLAYTLLAPVDRLASKQSLAPRVLILQLTLALCSAVLLFAASLLLTEVLCLNGPFRLAALAFIFESQMIWATVTHIANDWLAVPMAIAVFAWLIRCGARDVATDALVLGAVLGIGLLTKAYFLAFVPVVLASIIWKLYRRRLPIASALGSLAIIACVGGPWYLRNWRLYGNISGTQEAFDGIGFRQALDALPRIDWKATAGFMARSSLWTGNNSFTTFSRSTLNFELLLIAGGLILYFAGRRKIKAAEWWAVVTIVIFIGALGYATCAAWAHTGGETAGASPWYSQVLLAPIATLVLLGFQRARIPGRVMTVLIVLISWWIYAMTYFGKLLPLYSGFEAGRSTARDLWSWWSHDFRSHADLLSSTTLAPAEFLYCMALVVLLVQTVLTVTLLVRLSRGGDHC